jgi:archaellum biogenesis protein FlaJ (TadC family)
MDLKRLSRGEIIAILGGVLLGIGVFLPWYGTSSSKFSTIAGKTGDLSAWDVHKIMRLLLLAAAVAPLILAWIIIREHELSWPRGQVTTVVAIAAFGLIFYRGVIDRPGDVEISLEYGWFVALVGSILMLVGANMRVSETEIARKPPGTI